MACAGSWQICHDSSAQHRYMWGSAFATVASFQAMSCWWFIAHSANVDSQGSPFASALLCFHPELQCLSSFTNIGHITRAALDLINHAFPALLGYWVLCAQASVTVFCGGYLACLFLPVSERDMTPEG